MEATRQNIESLIQEVMEDNFCDTPEEINEGECFEFAKAFASMFGGVIYDGLDDEWGSEQFEGFETQVVPVNILPNDTTYKQPIVHCWVKLDGLYYDSETPEGVEDWTQLPVFLRYT